MKILNKLFNKKQIKSIKLVFFSIFNLFNKRYIVKYEDDNIDGITLETFHLSFKQSEKSYLKNQKLIRKYNEDKATKQIVLRYQEVILDTFTGILLNPNNCHIKKTSLKYPSLVPYTFLSKISRIDNSLANAHTYYFLNSLKSSYYHQWFDGLVYLYYLNKIDKKFIVIVPISCPDNMKDVLKNFESEFELRYVSERFINLPNTIKFTHISWAKHAPVFTKVMANFFISIILKNTPQIITFKKIFIGRKNTTTRKIVNNHEVINLFKKNNFEIIFLEDYSIQEQAYLFYCAHEIAGLHGAGFTNLIFCKPRTIVIELQNFVNVTTYYMISKQLDLIYHYVLPNEFDLNLIKDPSKDDRGFFKQKLKDTSYNIIKIKSILDEINAQ
jgi:hypothetical protein